MRLELRHLADLKPYAENAKKHTASDVALIAASIERFGFNDPIGIDEDGEIIEGHGRYEAALMLGLENVPVLVLPNFTDRQKRLYRIAHNKIALSSSFDFNILVEILRSVTGEDLTMQHLGFSEEAAHSLLNVIFAPENQLKPVSEIAVEPFTVIWENRDQKKKWDAFMKGVLGTFPFMSASEALSTFLLRSGVLTGTKVDALETDTILTGETGHVAS